MFNDPWRGYPDSAMASIPVVLLAALGATLYLSFAGLGLARWLLPAWAPAASIAPALSWGVFSAVSFPLQALFGFSQVSTAALLAIALVMSIVLLRRGRPQQIGAGWSGPELPVWAYVLAAAIALIPLAALLPKHADGGIILGTVSSDHSKIAIVDEMTRLGLPVGNPFFGAFGARSSLSYYYLWHLGAAQVSILTRISGWEADAAMTGVTAYASILLMMGLACRLSSPPEPGHPELSLKGVASRPAAAIVWVGLLSLTGTLGPVLVRLFGAPAMGRLITQTYAGLAGWATQASWVPQHMASACCVVLAVLLLVDLAERRRVGVILTVGALAAAGFGSSAWVGGITFALAAVGVGIVLLICSPSRRRLGFAVEAVVAALIALILAWPLLHAEFSTLGGRHGGAPIAYHPYEVIGDIAPAGLRRVLDYPAYWLVLLPIDLPAIYPAGLVALVMYARRAFGRPALRARSLSLVVLTAASLTTAWLLASTIGNNDLGWRAILPAVLVLTAFAAAGLARWIAVRAYAAAAGALVLFAASLPDPVLIGDLTGKTTDQAPAFAKAPALWAAVRRYAGPLDRVADNPLSFDEITDWPVNPAWAMMSNRASCYSGWETARAYVDLPQRRITDVDAQFIRIFNGKGVADDIRQMARDYGCRVVVLTADDEGWDTDPFEHSPYYRLAQEDEDAWRIYVSTPPRPAGR